MSENHLHVTCAIIEQDGRVMAAHPDGMEAAVSNARGDV